MIQLQGIETEQKSQPNHYFAGDNYHAGIHLEVFESKGNNKNNTIIITRIYCLRYEINFLDFIEKSTMKKFLERKSN